MEINNVDVSRLPADVRKQFKQLQVMYAEKKIRNKAKDDFLSFVKCCLLYTSPSPRDGLLSRMPSSA